MTAYAAVISLNSRFGAGAIAESLARKLGTAVDLTLTFVGSSEEATEAARAAAKRARIVIAVGGDGTVADVATGIAHSEAILGIVPAGSTNITARSLGVPANPRSAIQLLVDGHVAQAIDVGVSGNRCFLHMAGAGFDAEIFRSANADLKKLLGWLAYLPAAAAALRLTPSDVTVRTDDATLQAKSPLVLVANGASAVAPSFRLHPSIMVDDGWLDVLMFTATTPAQVAATIGHLGSMRLDRSPYVVWQRTRTVTIEADPRLSVELDGDIRGETPRTFSILPKGMRVLIPAVSES